MIKFKDKQKTLFKRIDKLRKNITPAEKIFKTRLDNLRINYIFQKGFIVGNYYCIVDFYIPKPHKLCIEIDGEYHNDSIQVKRDKRKDNYLINERGFKVLRIKNKDVNKYNLSIFL